MKYLVCRLDALRPHNTMKASDYFPMVIDWVGSASDPEEIVRKAFDVINQGYVGMHEYIVVPMRDAKVVSFRRIPVPTYETCVRDY